MILVLLLCDDLYIVYLDVPYLRLTTAIGIRKVDKLFCLGQLVTESALSSCTLPACPTMMCGWEMYASMTITSRS